MSERDSAPLVSVVMCLYNGEKFLAATIESALAQTYIHFELIVVDDGSTDESAAVLRRYTDPRIQVIRCENRGAVIALATGLRASTGAYVALLDQDDLWEPEMLQRHVEILESRPNIDLTFSWFTLIDDCGRDLGLHSNRYRGTIDFEHLLRDFVIGASSNVVIRQTAIRRTGVDPNLPRMYDLDLFLRIALLAPHNVEAIPLDLMRYRRHNKQISRQVDALREEWLQCLEKLRGLAPEQVASAEGRARSNMNRYFARLAYEGSRYRDALQLLGEGFGNAPGAFLADPRNWLTAAACLTGLLSPPSVHRKLERLAGLRRS